MNIKELEAVQYLDGSFGRFHSMSSDNQITTEKALRRFLFLGLNKDNKVVNKCLGYVKKCLNKELIIPDRREKVINWDVFEELMFASWLNIYDVIDDKVNTIKQTWKKVIECSIIDNEFDYNEYKVQYRTTFGLNGRREISPANFYMVVLLKNALVKEAKDAYFKYIMNKGIYYIYDHNLYELPKVFDSKATIAYLYAIKLIAPYSNKGDLEFVVKWLRQNITKEGYFNIPSLKADGIIFPRSENWKKKDNKLKDINEFIKEVLFELKDADSKDVKYEPTKGALDLKSQMIYGKIYGSKNK